VHFLGENVTDLAVDRRARKGMGRTFQQVGLVKGATVLENVKTARHAHLHYAAVAGNVGAPATFEEERALDHLAHRLLELVNLDEFAAERVADLPYGTMKNVEMAAVLATDPEILMLDEPGSGLGPEEADVLGDTLLRLRDELSMTILMIEHHVPLVVRICDYVYCLNFGEVLAEGSPDHVRNHPDVVAAYMGGDD
jgi:branched-chain amino acid transport system ATP-binding protein